MFTKVNQDKDLKPVKVVAAIIYNEANTILIAKRKDASGFWEFPGGKVEAHENNEMALARELKEELGLESIHIKYLFDSYTYDYPNKKVNLFFYSCFLKSTEGLQKNVHSRLEWVQVETLPTYNFLPGNRRIIRALYVEQQKL